MEIVLKNTKSKYLEIFSVLDLDNIHETFKKFSSIKEPLEAQIFAVNETISSHELSKLKTKILCVTHDISTITKIYDRVIMLKDGKIIADGDQNKVMNSENFNKLFGIQVEVTNNGLWNINRLSK